jgi:hypothetical protein
MAHARLKILGFWVSIWWCRRDMRAMRASENSIDLCIAKGPYPSGAQDSPAHEFDDVLDDACLRAGWSFGSVDGPSLKIGAGLSHRHLKTSVWFVRGIIGVTCRIGDAGWSTGEAMSTEGLVTVDGGESTTKLCKRFVDEGTRGIYRGDKDIVRTQQKIQFHHVYIQTGFGIGFYPLILTANSIHIQTMELKIVAISFPSWIWNFESNSFPS